jgi:hypothetical protein
MSFTEEITRSLRGVWRLARYDAGGLRQLNLTVEGFWRSFVVVALLLPPQLLMAWLVRDRDVVVADGGEAWLFARGAVFVVAWLTYVGSMAPISRLLKLSDNYPTYVIAFNWAALLQMALLLPVGLLYGFELVAAEAGIMLLMLAWLTVMAFDFVIARLALGADALTAAGIVIYAVVLELVIESAANAVLS